MKVAVLAFTRKGLGVALFLAQKREWAVYAPERLAEREGVHPLTGEFRDSIGRIFRSYEGLVFVSATGIAVRGIAPHIQSKWSDPAVVVVDEGRRFVVSLLSGHWGGGNRLVEEIAALLGATPVITTASDLSRVKTPEILAQELGFLVEERQNLPQVSALLLEGKNVVYLVEDEELGKRLRDEVKVVSEIPPEARGVVFVTDALVQKPSIPFLVLRPRRLVLGIGMRKGVPFDTLFAMVDDLLRKQGMALSGLEKIASVEEKRYEPALQELAVGLSVPLVFFSVEELRQVEGLFPISLKVRERLGVGSVARPSAFLASGRGRELGYFRGEGVTLALFQKERG